MFYHSHHLVSLFDTVNVPLILWGKGKAKYLFSLLGPTMTFSVSSPGWKSYIDGELKSFPRN